MSKVTDGGDEGNPLGTLAFGTLFESPAAMGRPIPFIVAGQVRLPDDSEPVAEKLGAVKTVTGWWIPLDLTPMLDGPVSRGDAVMQNFRVDHSVAGAPPMVVWDATCVRGKQYLRVRLKNGEISNDVFVNNVYMNAVSELEVTSVPNGELKMKVGEIKDGIQVFGKTDQANVRPELTRQDQCLAIESSQEGVLSLRRSETIALRADKAGSTKVTFSLRDASPAVAKVVPVTVEDKDSLFLGWLKNTNIFTAVAEGDMTCKYTDDGSTSRCGFGFDNTVYNAGMVPVVWIGETFTIQGSIDSPVSGKCDLDASGRFNPATKSISGRFKTSCKFTQGTTQRTSLVEFSLGELPTLFGVVPTQEGKSYVFTLNSNYGDSASLIKSRAELINYSETINQLAAQCGRRNWTA